ncbi:MAG: DHH family phosphoesterase [Anaerolineae bacterium]|jgi:phosphoesterase RecJ-like protein
MNDLQRIAELLAGADSVLLVSHVSPDGDTVGSTLGILWALHALGVPVRVACDDPVPQEAAFLPGAELYSSGPYAGEEVVLGVDASDLRRLGNIVAGVDLESIVFAEIDHHSTNEGFAALNYVRHSSSTAELALELVQALEAPLDARMATCLLTGLVSDTRGFRTNSTTAESLATAHTLVSAGGDLGLVTDRLFNRVSAAARKLWSVALAEQQLDDGILWVDLPLALLDSLGDGEPDTRGLIGLLISFDEARIAALFRELPEGGIDVSLRSRPGINVAHVALALGGGGHPQAAGCQLPGTLAAERPRVLAALQQALAAAEA